MNTTGCLLILIYLLTAIGLTPGGSSTVHIYTQPIHRTTQSTQTVHITTQLATSIVQIMKFLEKSRKKE